MTIDNPGFVTSWEIPLTFSNQIRKSHRTDDISNSIFTLLRCFDNQIQIIRIINRQHAAKCVGAKVFDEGSCKLVTVFEQELFKLNEIGERSTVGRDARGVNQWIFAHPSWNMLARSPLPDGIVLVER